MSDIITRALNGEVFEDDGWRFGPRLDAFLESLNNRPNSRHLGVYHPSEIAGCARKLYYGRIGKLPVERIPPNVRRLFDTGHAIHHQIDRYIEAMYPPDMVGYEVPISLPELHVLGHADILVFEVSRVVDIKSINKDRYGKLAQPVILPGGNVRPPTMAEYVWQGHLYMGATDYPKYTLFYWCKDNSEHNEFSFVFHAGLWRRIQDKIEHIEDCVGRGQPPDREIDRWRCPTCKYAHLCQPQGIQVWEPRQITEKDWAV